MATKTAKKKAKKSSNRPKKFEVWLHLKKLGRITVMARDEKEAKAKVEEEIEEAWEADDVGEWSHSEAFEIEIGSAHRKTGRR